MHTLRSTYCEVCTSKNSQLLLLLLLIIKSAEAENIIYAINEVFCENS